GSATRPHAANCVAIFPWASSGASRMARSASTPTNPCAPPAFNRFAELGSVRRVWLWFRSEGLCLPLRMHYGAKIRWVDPSYIAVYHILTNPVYAGAYAYGKSRHEITLDASGVRKKRARKLPRSQWQVFIPNHHEGFIDWNT